MEQQISTMESFIVSVDTGNKQIKTQNHLFTAGVVCHDSYPPFGKDVISYNGKFYTLSDKRIPYMRDKTADNRYFVLTLFGVAYELQQTGVCLEEPLNVTLLLGLPPAHFGVQEEKYHSYFKEYSQVEFEFNRQPVSLFISGVVVYPQAFAAVAPSISRFQEYPKAMVIDIGGYTADILKLANGRPDLAVCDSLEYGVINFYNRVIRRINSSFDLLLEESDIDRVLRSEKTLLPQDVVCRITNMAIDYVEDFFNQLRELGIDLKTCYSIFVGGGSILFRPFIEISDKLGQYTFIEDVKSNALGYARLYQLGL